MQRSLLTILVGLGTFVEEVDTVVGELLDLLSEVLVLILSSSLSLWWHSLSKVLFNLLIILFIINQCVCIKCSLSLYFLLKHLNINWLLRIIPKVLVVIKEVSASSRRLAKRIEVCIRVIIIILIFEVSLLKQYGRLEGILCTAVSHFSLVMSLVGVRVVTKRGSLMLASSTTRIVLLGIVTWGNYSGILLLVLAQLGWILEITCR